MTLNKAFREQYEKLQHLRLIATELKSEARAKEIEEIVSRVEHLMNAIGQYIVGQAGLLATAQKSLTTAQATQIDAETAAYMVNNPVPGVTLTPEIIALAATFVPPVAA